MTRRRLPLLGALVWVACAPPLSGFQPAHVAPAGHFQAEAGFDVSVPTGTIVRAVDAGKALIVAARQRSLSQDERRRLIEAGGNLALEPPAVLMHLALSFVPRKDWEVGLRYASGGLRIGVRTQLYTQESQGFDLSVGLGLSRHGAAFPVDSVLPYLTLDGLTRYGVDLPLLIGKRAPWYRLWGGPRLALTRFSAAMRLDLPAAGGAAAETALASVDGTGTLLALQGGAAVGYAHLFVGFELTVARLFSSARLSPGNQGQTNEIDLSGVIVSPGIALLGEF
jgi:hypothetical protein